ncbi:PIN domain-containing protein [Polaribacter sp. Hel_I_88]|uniref:type II toxin-antitoxin system VapC family toxin n=1 Tax=Polaribacter sp. Hel_I_88 TaxID=1250006 RepID=UPI00047D5A0E|nr:PIN domain-containing protein [Polaribacter sp. Hel_I_88]
MKTVFFDTNVMLDFLGERKLFYETASKLITLSERGSFRIVVSPVSFVNTNYILSKYENSKAALEKIGKFKVICQVSRIDSMMIEKSLQSSFTDFEDAVQYFSALDFGCEIIITRDSKGFKKSTIPVMSPDEFLNSLQY